MVSESTQSRVAEVIRLHQEKRPPPEELAACRPRPFPRRATNPAYQGVGNARELLLKFCINVRGRIPDICEREEFVSLVGQALAVPVVDAWVVESAPLGPVQLPPNDDLIRDRCVVMPLLDGPTPLDDKRRAREMIHAQLQHVADLFGFMHWLGDEDRGLMDVMLVKDEIVLVDNGLCGPGRSGTLRGAHPHEGVYRQRPDAIVKMCYPGKPSLVAFVLRDLRIPAIAFRHPDVLGRISALSEEAIGALVHAAGLNSWIADTLVLRRDLLPGSYLDWLGKAAQVCGY